MKLNHFLNGWKNILACAQTLACLATVFLSWTNDAQAQLVISNFNTTTITFDAGSPGLATASQYTGVGISDTVAGTLDSGVWAARISTDAAFNWNPMEQNPTTSSYGFFGTAQPALGGLRRTLHTPTSGSAGLGYADVSASRTLSIRTGNLVRNYVYIAVQNTTGSAVDSWQIDYDAWRTDQTTGVATVNFVYSTVSAANFVDAGANPTFTNVAALNFQTLGTGLGAGAFEAVSVTPQTINATVANNAYFIFGWQIRTTTNIAETFAFDNIAVTAIPEPATMALLVGGLTAAGCAARRRRS